MALKVPEALKTLTLLEEKLAGFVKNKNWWLLDHVNSGGSFPISRNVNRYHFHLFILLMRATC